MKILLAKKENLNAIMQIINDAKLWFKQNDIYQWQDGYPNEEVILKDIDLKQGFEVYYNNELIAYFVLSYAGDDNYLTVYNGSFSNDHDYAVIHRIAVAQNFKGQGLGKKTFLEIEKIVKNDGYDTIRIDTHHDNYVMRNLLKSLGYKECGDIILARSGALRVALDKVI